MNEVIAIRGARTHTLQNVDVDLPLGRFVVMTGVSGSGKSSLAFDTLFVETRRRYLDCLSPALRRLVRQWPAPDVDAIDGAPPTLSVAPSRGRGSLRQTLAMLADVYDPLRLLWVKAGRLFCPSCGGAAVATDRDAMVNRILALPERTKVMVLAPCARGETCDVATLCEQAMKEGFVRVRMDGEVVDAAQPPVGRTAQQMEVVVDRLMVKPDVLGRLQDSIEAAFRTGHGRCLVAIETAEGWRDELLSRTPYCAACDVTLPAIEMRLLSWLTPYGACPQCQGMGLLELGAACDACGGERLGPAGRALRLGNWSLSGWCRGTVQTAQVAVEQLAEVAAADAIGERVAARVLPRVKKRLAALEQLGLGYLSLDRPVGTLSGGEAQRVRLAASLCSELTGACYLLDEPTLGLHPADTQRLIAVCQQLRDQGHTVLAVEHDLELIAAADWVIELGPGAGKYGGRVVWSGTPAEMTDETATGRALRLAGFAMTKDERNTERATANEPACLSLRGAMLHHLQAVDVEIWRGRWTCVTGVSGSGKSSLIVQTLAPAVSRELGLSKPPCGPYRELAGIEGLTRVLMVDQSPLGRTARSNPATYTGLWDEMRKLLAKTKLSRLKGYGPQRFRLQSRTGCCARCGGLGVVRHEHKVLVELEAICPECRGQRFEPSTLEIRYKGRNAADLLAMSIGDAAEFWADVPRIARPLELMRDVGLGHVLLGQSATSLSGGEAQRVKLAAELGRAPAEGQCLYVLDEPTAGLHAADVQQLVVLFRRLREQGHTVVVVEHNVPLINEADWVIDLGPGAGEDGGRVVAAGTPAAVSAVAESKTGAALCRWRAISAAE